jgi:hypothetical protein
VGSRTHRPSRASAQRMEDTGRISWPAADSPNAAGQHLVLMEKTPGGSELQPGWLPRPAPAGYRRTEVSDLLRQYYHAKVTSPSSTSCSGFAAPRAIISS